MKSFQLKLGFHSYASPSLIRFQLRYEEDIEFNKLGLRDNVAQLCVLEVCYWATLRALELKFVFHMLLIFCYLFHCFIVQSVVPQNVQTDSTNLSTR